MADKGSWVVNHFGTMNMVKDVSKTSLMDLKGSQVSSLQNSKKQPEERNDENKIEGQITNFWGKSSS